MKKLRGLGFSLSEHIPVARWCLALVVIAFTAVVSVYKYIDLADTATFSSLEVMFLIITDVMNIVFIYLPLYLFVVCGITFDRGFGGIEMLRCGSRASWLCGKLITYLVNTLIFFVAMIAMDIVVCSCAFGFSDVWSGDFVGFRVMMGQSAEDFAHPPVITIITAAAAVLLFYVLCGMVNMLVSLLTDKESVAMLVSLLVGIALGLVNILALPSGMPWQLIRCGAFLALCAVVYGSCAAAVRKKDLCGNKLY